VEFTSLQSFPNTIEQLTLNQLVAGSSPLESQTAIKQAAIICVLPPVFDIDMTYYQFEDQAR
jgi:hypothetical protein